MARGFKIDLSKLGEQVPKGLQRATKAVAKPVVIADAVTSPESWVDLAEDAGSPITARRLRRCTIRTRAHVLGIADLPEISYRSGRLWVALLRVRVERPDGDAEACVRQHIPYEIRRLAPGSSLRALAHEEERHIVAVDWKATGEHLGQQLDWATGPDQYAWPDPDEWPAVDAIEVRDKWRHRRRIEKQRAEWTPATAQLLDASSRGGLVDDRKVWKLDLDLRGRRVTVKERVPELALAKLVGSKPGGKKLGGLVTTLERVVNTGATLAALVSPGGEVAVDWEATLNQPEWRET